MKIVRVLAISFIFLSIALFFFSDNKADPDLWGHLKYGQDTYENRQLTRTDIYSYSSYGARWINHEWLSELIFYTIFRFTKGAGLIIFKVLIGLALTLILFVSIPIPTINPPCRLHQANEIKGIAYSHFGLEVCSNLSIKNTKAAKNKYVKIWGLVIKP